MCRYNCFECPYADCKVNTVSDEERNKQDDYDRKVVYDRNSYDCKYRYSSSEKGKARALRYNKSDKGKNAAKRYNNSIKGKERALRYNESAKGKKRTATYEKKRLALQWLERYERIYKGTSKNTNARRCKARRLREKYAS